MLVNLTYLKIKIYLNDHEFPVTKSEKSAKIYSSQKPIMKKDGDFFDS